MNQLLRILHSVCLLFCITHEIMASCDRLPGSSSGISDPKVSAFGNAMGNHIKAHDASTFWEKGRVSVGKDGVGYNFDNGARAAIGDNGLTYKFNNGAEVHGKPTADGWEAGFKKNF